jgi:peptide-methionine (S)-S-oxide reductase
MSRFTIGCGALLVLATAHPCLAAPRLETAVLAGGCFWGVEAVFEHVKGVKSVVSGYAGGKASDANYSAVSSEQTGHAEAVRITYDPAQISFAQLLKIHSTVAHDPTQVNRQGPDVGPSYRSAIFPQSAAQRRLAERFLAQLRTSGMYKRPIATRIESGAFYPAEASHQDFMRRNPYHPYIVVHDRPKVAKLKRTYPTLWRA